MYVKTVSKTTHPDMTPEQLIVHIARVSNPANQMNHDTAPKLLRYCLEHGHWSPFEMVHWTVSIETSRAIAAQILRHRSFSFQEFSQRYSDANILGRARLTEPLELRMKNAAGNRQGSGELCASEELNELAAGVIAEAEYVYNKLIEGGVAPECARMVLPLSTTTKLYMCGNIRSWIHYIYSRTYSRVQKEHRDVALAAYELLKVEFPITAAAIQAMIDERAARMLN